MEKNKTLIIVSSYIYNDETEIILNRSLDTLSETGFDILIVSNSTMKPETLTKSNYHLFISDAISFSEDYTNIREINFWYGYESPESPDWFGVNHFMVSYQSYGLSVLRNLFTSLDLAQSLGYSSFIYVTGDNIFGKNSIDFLKNIPEVCSSQGKKALIYYNGDYEVSTVPIYSEISYFREIIKSIKSEEEYREFLLKTQGSLDFMDVEKYFFHNLKNSDSSFVLRKSEEDIFTDFSDTKFNLVTGVYNTSKKYKGFLTSLFKRVNKRGEHRGYFIFSRNLNPDAESRKIEVYLPSGDVQVIHHGISPNCWRFDFFDEVEKIRVYEEEIFLYEENNQTRSYIQDNKD
jgi:hypothetical protein